PSAAATHPDVPATPSSAFRMSGRSPHRQRKTTQTAAGMCKSHKPAGPAPPRRPGPAESHPAYAAAASPAASDCPEYPASTGLSPRLSAATAAGLTVPYGLLLLSSRPLQLPSSPSRSPPPLGPASGRSLALQEHAAPAVAAHRRAA